MVMYIKICLLVLMFSLNSFGFSQKKKPITNSKTKQVVNSFTGDYESSSTGSSIFINLTEKNNTVSGTLTMNGELAKINGTIKDRVASGTIVEVDSKISYNFQAKKSAETLNFSIRIIGQNSNSVNLVFNKIKPQKLNSAIASKSRDSKLLGTWRHTEVISSGSGQFYSSFSTDYFVKFNADGTAFEWTGKSAGGTNSATIDANGNGKVQRMQWYTVGKVLYLVNPSNSQTAQVNYYAESNRMMLSSNNSKKIYTRIN